MLLSCAAFAGGTGETEINSPELDRSLLIAIQKSDFKSAVVSGIIEHLREKPVYIKVVGISSLSKVKENDWSAALIIQAVQAGKTPSEVKEYLDRAKDLSKVLLVTTSGLGKWENKDRRIDAITAVSKKEELRPLTDTILAKLEKILKL